MDSTGSPSPPATARFCDWCGTPAPGGSPPLTWITSVEGNGPTAVTKLYCEHCSREHLRAIEGKLDSAWW